MGKPSDLRRYGSSFSEFITTNDDSFNSITNSSPTIQQTIIDLAPSLKLSPDDGLGGIWVFLELDSGFQRSQERQFWAVCHCHDLNFLDIYVSKNVDDLMGTILHAFLTSRDFNRRQCFSVEAAFARWNLTLTLPHGLPPRVVQDIELVSPEDCLLLLQRISPALNSGSDIFLSDLKSAILERLVDKPSWNQLKPVNTVDYLDEDVSIEDLLNSRLQWHCQSTRCHPDLRTAILLFKEVQVTITKILRSRNRIDLQAFVDFLTELLGDPDFNATRDIFVLATFCVMRELAPEEVYIEITDWNALSNDDTDQAVAVAFAELFALGSRCEAYFDISPGQFGELQSKSYCNYYSKPEYQPPIFEETQATLPFAYTKAQIDVDPNYTPHKMPAYKRFTLLSVFTITALVDMLMLTMTGHGMHLSSAGFMTFEGQHSATTALMMSLLPAGAIGRWITCCGTYCLTSMAFSALNYFVITRLLGGFAFTLIVKLVGFIAFA